MPYSQQMATLNQYYFYSRGRDGEFFDLFHAYDCHYKKLVTIKVTNSCGQPERLKITNKQKKVLNEIRHGSILGVQKQFSRGELGYLVMEYCSGGNLYQYLSQHSEINEGQVQFITESLLNGLSYLEGKGITHRSIKLQNILVDQSCKVKLAHFNFEKLDDICQSQPPLSTLAPEIKEGRTNVYDSKCDIWSLGAVIYQLLFKQNPLSYNPYYKQKRVIHFPQQARASELSKDFIRICLEYQSSKRRTVTELLDHPWMKAKKFHKLQYSMPDLERVQLAYKRYKQREQTKQMCKEYDNEIIRSIVEWKRMYLQRIKRLGQVFNLVHTYLMEKKWLTILRLFHTFMMHKVEEMRSVRIEAYLPAGMFVVEYHLDEIKPSVSDVIDNIRRGIKHNEAITYDSINSLITQSNPQRQYQEIKRELIGELLKQGQYISQSSPQYHSLWKIINYVVQLIKSNTNHFGIRYEYHLSLTPNSQSQQTFISKINKIKQAMTIHEFQQLYESSRFKVNIQKLDVLEYDIFDSPPESDTGFYSILLPFLEQTSLL